MVPHDNGDDFVGPILQQKLAGDSVSFAKAIDIADGPATHGAFARHPWISADGTKAFAFRHSGADGFGDFAGVAGLRHFSSSFSHARYCVSVSHSFAPEQMNCNALTAASCDEMRGENHVHRPDIAHKL